MIATQNIIVCDGSCLRNPGPGGWAYGFVQGTNVQYYSGCRENATNNIMELVAMIEAMQHYETVHEIYTDSTYVVNGINSWLAQWKKSGWKNSQNKIVKNLDLWQKIDQIYDKKIKIKWIKGHAKPSDYQDSHERFLIEVQNHVDRIAREACDGVVKCG